MEKKETAILLIHCPDKQGILAAVTDFINVNKGNIIYLDQHVDYVQNTFFMRVEWELDNFIIPMEKIEDYFNTLYAIKYEMKFLKSVCQWMASEFLLGRQMFLKTKLPV